MKSILTQRNTLTVMSRWGKRKNACTSRKMLKRSRSNAVKPMKSSQFYLCDWEGNTLPLAPPVAFFITVECSTSPLLCACSVIIQSNCVFMSFIYQSICDFLCSRAACVGAAGARKRTRRKFADVANGRSGKEKCYIYENRKLKAVHTSHRGGIGLSRVWISNTELLFSERAGVWMWAHIRTAPNKERHELLLWCAYK